MSRGLKILQLLNKKIPEMQPQFSSISSSPSLQNVTYQSITKDILEAPKSQDQSQIIPSNNENQESSNFNQTPNQIIFRTNDEFDTLFAEALNNDVVFDFNGNTNCQVLQLQPSGSSEIYEQNPSDITNANTDFSQELTYENLTTMDTDENISCLNTENQIQYNSEKDGDKSSDDDSTYKPSEESENGSEEIRSETEAENKEEGSRNFDDGNTSKKRKLLNIKRDSVYEQNKKNRQLGLPYKGKKKNDGKWDYEVFRPGKFLSNPCNCKLSSKSKTALECRKLSEVERRKLFILFWKKTWSEKREFIKGLAKLSLVQRRRCEAEQSRRNFSIKYFLNINLKQYRVCKKMFNYTLGLKENCVLSWVKRDLDENMEDTDGDLNNKVNRKHARSRLSEVINENLKSFFNSLPKMESHYCRASTQRLYLEPIWQTKQDLYRFYVNQYCTEKNIKPVSRTTFDEKFYHMNLSLYRPRKDQCDTCVAHKAKTITDEEYDNHLTLKEEARTAKENDIKSDTSDFVFTMDMQSVLLAPLNKVSSMYYKTKLAVHNFTIYNTKTHDGFCFLWNETEGGLTANEFSSILVSFIEAEVLPNIEDKSSSTIIFWSDGCTGQNRNAGLANALLNASVTHGIVIIQKYLFKGHTQMEADAMHSAIERRVRNRDINVPADYVIHCKNARMKPFPYKVQYLEHSFFKDFSQVKYYGCIRPGRKVGDPTVTDLKAIKYSPDGVIYYKLRHTSDDWTPLNIRVNKKIQQPYRFEDLENLYKNRRPIKKEKYEHLQALKKSLRSDYHSFYDNIPFQKQ